MQIWPHKNSDWYSLVCLLVESITAACALSNHQGGLASFIFDSQIHVGVLEQHFDHCFITFLCCQHQGCCAMIALCEKYASTRFTGLNRYWMVVTAG